MKKYLYALFMAVLVLTLAACGSKGVMRESSYDAEIPMEAGAMTEEVYMESASADFAADSNLDAGNAVLPQNRKWVITMDISAETEDLDEAVKAVESRVSALGGYLENRDMNNGSVSSSRRSRSIWMSVRVPADRTDEFVQEVSGVTNVVSSSKRVEDITLAYTDTEGRVNALKAEETRLLELMEKAENMSDLLEIESRLTEIRYQLERHTSQLRRYDNQVDYATIGLSIREVQRYTPAEKLSFWQRTGKGFRESVEDLGDTLVSFVEWVIVDLPWLVFFGFLAWGGSKLVKKQVLRRKNKKAAQKEQPDKSES